MEGLVLLVLLIAVVFFSLLDASNARAQNQQEEPAASEETACHLYEGRKLHFTDTEMDAACEKYNPFYKQLPGEKKLIFLQRLKGFMHSKDFYIAGPNLYKEVPILISAAATQISFGLQEYRFPHFSNIVIHPQEYIGYDPLRILIGNVQGRTITLSWKHFLEDYKNPADGKNVGLHEMAHALQVQFVFQNYGYRSEFKTDYEHYDKIDDEVLLEERTNSSSLFDSNALNDPNEFWATCVELFFEKPRELSARHPRLYMSLSMVLNQDPCEGSTF